MPTRVRSHHLALAPLALLACLGLGCGGDGPSASAFAPPGSGSGMDVSDAGTVVDGGEVPVVDVAPCTDERNPHGIAPPAEDEERSGYRFELASETMVRSVSGTVIDHGAIRDPGAIDRAYLLGTGGYLDDGCITMQKGASFSWQGVACGTEDGTLFNVLVVVPEDFDPGLAGFGRGDSVRLSGYEIERLNDFSPGGGYWTDGGDNPETGQVTLWLTDVCILAGP